MNSKIVWFIAAVLAILLFIFAAASNLFSNLVIAVETVSVADSLAIMQEIGLPDLPPPEEVIIDAGDVSLAGLFYENDLDGNCAVLLLHGISGTRYSALQYAPLFWDRGCDIFAYDARGHGASSDAYLTYGYYEKNDGQVAYEWLLARTGLPPSRVGMTGVSYGAATSLQMLPLLPEAAFVIADSSYESLESIITYQANQRFGPWINAFVPVAFFLAEIRADFDRDVVTPKETIASTSVPVLLIHSQTDTFTPSTHSEAIFENSDPATTELILTDWGSPHARDIFTDYESYEMVVDGFLATHVPGFGLADGR